MRDVYAYSYDSSNYPCPKSEYRYITDEIFHQLELKKFNLNFCFNRVFLPATFNIFNKPIVESTYVFDTVDLNIEEMIKEIDEWVNENKENKNENSIIYIYTVFKCIDHYYIRCYRERYKKIKILGE